MTGDIIDNIEISDFSGKDFKYNSCLDIINKLNVGKNEVYGIGDSIHDVKMLSLAGHKFGIDPKGDFKELVDIVIDDDISDVIKYL